MSRQLTSGVLGRKKGDVWLYKGEVWEYGEITNPITGRTWMDRNLGASRVATAFNDSQSYGDYFQWGRLDDLHQNVDSETTNDLSSSNTPNNGGKFILSTADWRDPSNSTLWSDGLNIPAPKGWRLPTEAEWLDEIATWVDKNYDGAFENLKIPKSGRRNGNDGNRVFTNNLMWLWTSTSTSLTNSRFANITSSNATTSFTYRAQGMPIRLIKEI